MYVRIHIRRMNSNVLSSRLFSTAETRATMTTATLLPPRTLLDVVVKALEGASSLVLDQKFRESYLTYVEKGILRDDVFFQNGSNIILAPLLVLSLLQELDEAQKFGFRVDEFMEGVRPALEQFHTVEKTVDNQLRDLMKDAEKTTTTSGGAAVGTKRMTSEFQRKYNVPLMTSVFERDYKNKPVTSTTSTTASSTTSSSSQGGSPFTKEQRAMLTALMEREAEFLQALRGTTNRTTVKSPTVRPMMSSVLEWDWSSEESQQLQSMVSAEFFKTLQEEKAIGSMMQKLRGPDIEFQDDSATVENVALLSARIMVMDQEEEAINYDTIRDDELNLAEREDKHVVAAQIEVLYDVQHSYNVEKGMFSSFDDDNADDAATGPSKRGELTQRIIRVGVLEGYLKGKAEGLRWKLAVVRDPWEIPPMQPDIDFRPS